MEHRGRPITTVNDSNDSYLMRYFLRIVNNYEDEAIFFQDPTKRYEAGQELHNVIALSNHGNPSTSELAQTQKNNYHLRFAQWLDTFITEKGFQRCLNAMHQYHHRRFPKKRKKIHTDIPGEADDNLTRIAHKLALSKQAALVRILAEAHQTYCENN